MHKVMIITDTKGTSPEGCRRSCFYVNGFADKFAPLAQAIK
jgi:hypothetical protein